MTNETRLRIEAYKNALPDMKERVFAVALLLVMSIMMVTSASFAWLTLSQAPEALGMQTTVASNGNLEIALAQGLTGSPAIAPEESEIGDSSAAKDQSIIDANVTWGNMVNVSDPTYGISQIALRPALLSGYNRTDYPLNGATYGKDGRVVTTSERYEYTSYSKIEGSTDYYFAAGYNAEGKSLVNYGVRAISSIGYVNYSGNVRLKTYSETTSQYYTNAQTYYGAIVSNTPNEVNTLATGVTCISALEGLVTVFAQDKINEMGYGSDSGSTNTSCSKYLWYVYQMMLRLEHVLELEGIALLEMANWQAYVDSGDAKTENTFESVEQLLNASSTQLASLGIKIDTLQNYKSDLTSLRKCIYGDGTANYTGIKVMADNCSNPDAITVDYYWDDIAKYINVLVDIDSATMNGKKLSAISGVMDALAIIGGGDVVVYEGILANTELRLVDNANRVQADVTVKVSTSIAGDPEIDGVVYTSAYGKEPLYTADLNYSAGLESVAKGEATAKDTYGMAIDLWVRTNQADAVLTLEGSALYEDEWATGVDSDNNEVYLYTITVNEVSTDVYEKDGKWYYANGHKEVQEEYFGDQIPEKKYIQVVVGYEGENRIWEDWRDLLEGGYIEQDATTQGAGSCFVFYANTPTEQAKIKEMLEAFNVAFIDQTGKLLGTARLNLENAYENQGKVTVPLEVESGVKYTDESGEEHVGIVSLTQNTPLMITAIIYLNGQQINNENVLEDGNLQGQLNIQFGSSQALVAPNNEELQSQARSITATVTVNGETISDGTIGGENGLDYKPEGYPAVVTLNVEGEQPESIKGFFVRTISATQGTRGEEITFTRNEDDTWTGRYTLKNPGTYVFNTLLVDGVQYTLHDGTQKKGPNEYYEPNRPKVYINGLQLTSVSVDVVPGTYMTADTSKDFTVSAVIDTALEPKRVTAQFFSKDNSKQYTAILTYDELNDQWVGTANIRSSGTYTLKYISVGEDTVEVPNQSDYVLYLGLKASVSTTLDKNDWQFPFIGATQIGMIVRVYDDGDKPIKKLTGLELSYNNVKSPTPLTWNEDEDYYEGVFDIVQAGELTFKYLILGNAGTLYKAAEAPVFRAISMVLPEYRGAEAEAKQIKLKENEVPKMEVTLNNATTAVVWAEVQYENPVNNEKDTLYIMSNEDFVGQDGSKKGGNSRSFDLPRQDGIYKLKRIFFQDVYDKDYVNADGTVGRWYASTGETPTIEDSYILESEQIETEVVVTLNIEVYYDENKDKAFASGEIRKTDFTVNLSGTKETPTGLFMQGVTPGSIGVKITDYRGRILEEVTESTEPLKESKTKLVIVYNEATDTTYGGYDGAYVGDVEVALVQNAENGMFAATIPTLYHSGEYTATIYMDIDGNQNELVVNPKFTIATKKMELSIDSIAPNKTHSTVNKDGDNPRQIDNVTSRIEGNTVTIYPEATVTDGCDGKKQASMVDPHPNVTLKLTNIGYADSATLTFTSDQSEVRLYTSKGSGQVSAYTWSSSNELVTRYVGKYTGTSCSDVYDAGVLTSSDKVEVQVSGNVYTVNVTPITIINNRPD